MIGGGIMNEAVDKIVNVLIQKVLKNENEDEIIKEEEIIKELLKQGYDIKDIDRAFELIYNTSEIIEEDFDYDGYEIEHRYNRIFSVPEKIYLSVEVRGMIMKIMASKFLTANEYEEIIIRAIHNSYNGLNSLHYFWDIVEDVVKDENRLNLIYNNIDMKENNRRYKYVN